MLKTLESKRITRVKGMIADIRSQIRDLSDRELRVYSQEARTFGMTCLSLLVDEARQRWGTKWKGVIYADKCEATHAQELPGRAA